MLGTVHRVCRNVKRWRNAVMALRWAAAGMMRQASSQMELKRTPMLHSMFHGNARFA
jgi:hypothetical protein